MRIGRSVHGQGTSTPQWCHRFSLERGVGIRQLHVSPREGNRPDWYNSIQFYSSRYIFYDAMGILVKPLLIFCTSLYTCTCTLHMLV